MTQKQARVEHFIIYSVADIRSITFYFSIAFLAAHLEKGVLTDALLSFPLSQMNRYAGYVGNHYIACNQESVYINILSRDGSREGVQGTCAPLFPSEKLCSPFLIRILFCYLDSKGFIPPWAYIVLLPCTPL